MRTERSLLVFQKDDWPEVGKLQHLDRAELAFNGGASAAADQCRLGNIRDPAQLLPDDGAVLQSESREALVILTLAAANLPIGGKPDPEPNPPRQRQQAERTE